MATFAGGRRAARLPHRHADQVECRVLRVKRDGLLVERGAVQLGGASA
jgi:hypothetical protein